MGPAGTVSLLYTQFRRSYLMNYGFDFAVPPMFPNETFPSSSLM